MFSTTAATSCSSSARLRPLTSSIETTEVVDSDCQAACSRWAPRLGRSLARLAVQPTPSNCRRSGSSSPARRYAAIAIARAVAAEQ